VIDFLRRTPLFSKLNDTQLQAISTICNRRFFKASTILFKEKEPGNILFIVPSGSVKIYSTSHGGEERIITIFNAGDNFGEFALIDGKPRSTSAAVLEDSYLIAIQGDHFLQVCKDNFEIALGVMQELTQRLRDTNQHVHDLTFLDARSRVIKNMILLANKNGSRQGNVITIRLSLNYDEISRMAGVQKNVLMQVIRDMEERQMLVVTPTQFTLDLGRLKQ